MKPKIFFKLSGIVVFLALLVPALPSPGLASPGGNAIVSVLTPGDAVNPGEEFTIGIVVDPNNDISGMQFSLSFDPGMVTAENLTEGDLLRQGGEATFFQNGKIDNEEGTITGVFGIILNPGQSISKAGTFASITFVAGDMIGSCSFTLSDVIAATPGGQAIPTSIVNNTISIDKAYHPSLSNPMPAATNQLSSMSFTLSELNTDPLRSNLGEDVNISVRVENTGNVTGVYRAVLYIDNVQVQTRDVSLDAGSSQTVSFDFVPDTPGTHKAAVGDLFTPFEVSPAIGHVSGLELVSFSARPNYDKATGRLLSARIAYQTDQTEKSVQNARLILTVDYEDRLLEDVSLLTRGALPPDGETGVMSYIPANGWKAGEYSFRVELYTGDSLLQTTSPQAINVSPDSIMKTGNKVNLFIIIAILIGVALAITFLDRFFRRHYWIWR